jgi:hypothetical protein
MKRTSSEADYTRKFKTELLQQLDFVKEKDCVIIGCTNTLEDLDTAVVRRFNTTIFCGLPEKEDRIKLIKYYLKLDTVLEPNEIEEIAEKTHLFSASDIERLCKQARLNVITCYQSAKFFVKNREGKYEPCDPMNEDKEEKRLKDLENIQLAPRRKVNYKDLIDGLKITSPAITQQEYNRYLKLREEYQSVPLTSISYDEQTESQAILDEIFGLNQTIDVVNGFKKFLALSVGGDENYSTWKIYSVVLVMAIVLISLMPKYVSFIVYIFICLIAAGWFYISVGLPLFELLRSLHKKEYQSLQMDVAANLILFFSGLLLMLMPSLPFFNFVSPLLDIYPFIYIVQNISTLIAVLIQYFVMKRQYFSKKNG